jgi:transcriptional regulator with XRE-family HTH domain
MEAIEKRFGRKILELRKARGWSQQELARRLGTSGVIVGRYERGGMTPSIKVASKLAEIFGVTIDSLIAEREIPDILHDSGMIARWKAIDELGADDREKVLFVVDSILRDARARQTYAATA